MTSENISLNKLRLFLADLATEELDIDDLKLLEEYLEHQYMRPRYAEVIRKISRIVRQHELAGNTSSST